MKYAVRKPYTRKTVKSKSSKKCSKPDKCFIKKVQSIIHKDVETKQAFYNFPLTAFNSGINSIGDACQVLPSVVNGTAQNERIGDQLRTMSLTIKGHAIASTSLLSLTSSNSRIGIRLMVVQPKYLLNSNYAAVNFSGWMSNLLRKGGTATAFTGTISDLYAPINTECVTSMYDKVIYITTPTLFNTAATTNLVAADVTNACKFFSINIKCKNKLLKYESGVDGLVPLNYAPILIMGYVHLDGASPDVLTTQVSLAYDVVMDYEDA